MPKPPVHMCQCTVPLMPLGFMRDFAVPVRDCEESQGTRNSTIGVCACVYNVYAHAHTHGAFERVTGNSGRNLSGHAPTTPGAIYAARREVAVQFPDTSI